jgi:hypothetical protein
MQAKTGGGLPPTLTQDLNQDQRSPPAAAAPPGLEVGVNDPHPDLAAMTLPLSPMDQDLDWVCRRRCGYEPVRVLLAAQHLAQRAQRHADKLHKPDAWFHLQTHRLQFTDPGPLAPGYVGLCPGDSLHSSHVLRVSFLWHDMVYVGLGYMVSLNRIDSWLAGEISLDRVDVYAWPPGCRIIVNDFPRYMARARVVQRALATVGYYNYDPVRFNCQHVFHAIMGNQPHSIGAEQLLALTFACTLLLAGIIVAIFLACIRLRRSRLRTVRTQL